MIQTRYRKAFEFGQDRVGGGGSVQVSTTTWAALSAAVGALQGLRVLSRNRPLNSRFGEALSPAPHSWLADANALRNPLCRSAIGRSEQDGARSTYFCRWLWLATIAGQPLRVRRR